MYFSRGIFIERMYNFETIICTLLRRGDEMRYLISCGMIFLLLIVASCEQKSTKEAALENVTPTPEKVEEKPAKVVPSRYYYTNKISSYALHGKTLRELSLMRNTIFARAGNAFRKKWLREYFEKESWYEPTGLDYSKLSETDIFNAKIIADHELRIPAQELWSRYFDIDHRKTIGDSLDATSKIELQLLARALGEPVTNPDNENPLDNIALLDSLLTLQHLEDYSRRDLRILRNTIYARHGRPFKSQVLKDYFARMKWYQQEADFSETRLNEIDKKNIQLILSVEQSIGGPLTDAAHQEREAELQEEIHWMGGA